MWSHVAVYTSADAQRQGRMRRRLAWGLVTTTAIVIAILSLVPHPEEIVPVHLWDKLSHFLAYGFLSVTLCYALVCSELGRRRTAALTPLLATAYGGLLELLQFLAPSRSPDLTDALANAVGAGIGIACFLLLDALVRRLAQEPERQACAPTHAGPPN